MKYEYKKIHDHTYVPSLIRPDEYVLDLGCNDFVFSRHFVEMGAKVIGIDPMKDINVPADLMGNERFTYMRYACIGLPNTKEITYYEYNGWGANSVYNTPEKLHRKINRGHSRNRLKTQYTVPTITLTEIMEKFGIKRFALIKMDIEGAEYDILDNFPQKCSRQMSIEFHDFLHLNPYPDPLAYHRNLRSKMSDYEVVYESPSKDDVLMVLRD